MSNIYENLYSNTNKQRKTNIISILAFLIVFFSVFSKTVYSSVSIIVVFCCSFVSILFIKGAFLSKADIIVLCLFYSIPFLWIVTSAIQCFISGTKYIAFVPYTIGRFVNYFMYLWMYLVIRFMCQKRNLSTKSILSMYSWGCVVLLFLGLWQLFHYLFGIPFLNIETRNHLHSMGDFKALGFRVTSIAEEPAYLVPYMIDLFIILIYSPVSGFTSTIHKKRFVLGSIIIVLLFTLSLSAYCNIAFIIFVMYFFMPRSKKKRWLGFFLCFFLVLLVFLAGNMLFAVLKRLNINDLLKSSRLQEMYLPILHMIKHDSIFTILFGYGTKGFDYMRQFVYYVVGWQQGKSIAITSHVIFIDFFVEYGVVGVLIIISLFSYLWYMSYRIFRNGGGRLAQVLMINLLITSLYTSDYASPRFSIIICFIVSMYLESKKEVCL